MRPDGDSSTNRSLRSERNMRAEMVSVDSARPAVRGCSLGLRIENAGSWKCSWCGRTNVRRRAGLDHCSACNAEAFTYFTGVENELRIRYSRPPLRLSDRAVRFNSNGLRGVQEPSMSSVALTVSS